MSNKGVTVINKSGASITGLLGVAFVILKLTGVIAWSWWWVTAPFWGGIAVAIAIIIGTLAFSILGLLIASIIVGISKIITRIS